MIPVPPAPSRARRARVLMLSQLLAMTREPPAGVVCACNAATHASGRTLSIDALPQPLAEEPTAPVVSR